MHRLSIKAIETKYNGYRFRSRLEARWAVFFDEMNIKYEYELEGYKLPSGAGYLPDFFLPELELFVEVKPTTNIPIRELRKLVEFAQADDNKLLLIVGTPTNEEMFIVDRRSAPLDELDSSESFSDDELATMFVDALTEWGNVSFGISPFSTHWTISYKTLPPPTQQTVRAALLAAKQSRFEHGESGPSS